MKIFKRNQLVILVISLMMLTAGYLNFTSTYNNDEQVNTEIANLNEEADNSSFGDAQFVSNTETKEDIKEVEQTPKPIDTDAKLVVKTEDKEDYYFENSKLDREKMFSQMLESYQKIYDEANNSEEQKKMATAEISRINGTKNAIMICENLIKIKGIKDLVIFVNDNQVSVVVDEKELSTEKIAQIQNIISRELHVIIENIHISCK